MLKLKVNDTEVEVEEGLTVLQACEKAGPAHIVIKTTTIVLNRFIIDSFVLIGVFKQTAFYHSRDGVELGGLR